MLPEPEHGGAPRCARVPDTWFPTYLPAVPPAGAQLSVDPSWVHFLINVPATCSWLTGVWLSHHAVVRDPLVSRVEPSWVCSGGLPIGYP